MKKNLIIVLKIVAVIFVGVIFFVSFYKVRQIIKNHNVEQTTTICE